VLPQSLPQPEADPGNIHAVQLPSGPGGIQEDHEPVADDARPEQLIRGSHPAGLKVAQERADLSQNTVVSLPGFRVIPQLVLENTDGQHAELMFGGKLPGNPHEQVIE
jgi:hypothetical protein